MEQMLKEKRWKTIIRREYNVQTASPKENQGPTVAEKAPTVEELPHQLRDKHTRELYLMRRFNTLKSRSTKKGEFGRFQQGTRMDSNTSL